MTKYGYTKEVNFSFEEAIDEIIISLGKEKFGILTKIDMQEAMKKKLGEDIEKYVVLGACNPLLAFEAINSEYEIGLVLPCNVIVYEKKSKVFVSVILPTKGIGFIENEKITEIAKKAEKKLKKAIDSI